MKKLLHALRSWLYRQATEWLVHCTWIEGRPRGAAENAAEIRVLLATRRGSGTAAYYPQLLFAPGARQRVIGWRPVPALARLARRGGAALCIADLHRRWSGGLGVPGAIRGPKLVHQRIDLSGDLAAVKSRMRTRYRTIFNRHAQRSPYTIRVSREPADFDHFYERMFLPHVAQKFEGYAVLDGRAELQAYFERGFLLIAHDGQRDVAATLCAHQAQGLSYHRAGVLDGDEAHVRAGAQLALYVHMILQGHAAGAARLDLGQSRPTLSDGVFHHKRCWGARIDDEDDERSIHLFSPGSPRALRELIGREPMVGYHAGRLVAYVAPEPPPEDSAAARAALWKEIGSAGLAGYCLPEADGPGWRFVPMDGGAEG